MNQTILFDIDKTLVNTPELYRAKIVPALCQHLELSESEFEQREQEYANTLEETTDFDPEKLLQYLTSSDNVTELAENTIYNPQFFKDSIYPDVTPNLDLLSQSYNLGIFSQGQAYWQLKKLQLTGLEHFFSETITFIWLRKTAPDHMAQLPKHSVIIDDNPVVISELQRAEDIIPIWIDRWHRPPLLATNTITSLDNLPALLTTLGKHA